MLMKADDQLANDKRCVTLLRWTALPLIKNRFIKKHWLEHITNS